MRLLRNEGNRGEPYTLMRAHAAARGEWLAPLDGDDAWLPNRLERMLSERGAEHADAISDDLYESNRMARPRGAACSIAGRPR